MTPHLSDEQIRAYRERVLAARDLLEISEHLGSCDSCRARVAAPQEVASTVSMVKAALRTEAEGVHPGYDEMEAYVDGKLDAGERSGIEAHARDCRPCAASLRELEGLRRELEGSFARPEPARRPSRLWNGWIGWRWGLAAAAAAGILVAIVLTRVPGRQEQTVAQITEPAAPTRTGSVIHDGTRLIALGSGGGIQGLDRLSGPYQALLQRTLANQRIETAASLTDLSGTGGLLLGAPSAPTRGKLLGPLGTVVEDPRPVFRWQPVAGATYAVSVYDASYNRIAASPPLTAAEWRIPKPLTRGERYSWQLTIRQKVEFTLPAPPAPEARFRVLSEADEAELAQARADWGDSHLVLGVLYARVGLLDDAEQEMQALRAQNPESQQVAALEASVERLRAGTNR